ncbi:carbohydrate kinase family protein [Salipaludibacillus sp. HK11]|uniref:carbohydrate kinase family protein n=1 Tax=Salipaludibacillus sp. HK11 TaxID=3394320 RepID=UPI0039FD39DA
MVTLNQTYSLRNKSIDVLSIGEILVDMISDSYENLHGNNRFQVFFGGSPANICMNVNKLGAKAKLCASVGNDRFGDFLVSHLEKQKVETDLIQRTKLPTSMVVVNKSKDTPVPAFYRGADYGFHFTEQLKKAIDESMILHISSWPISKKASREVINQAIDYAKDQGVLIGFDPNYHQGLWEDNEDGTEIIKEVIGKVDILKPSEDDANRLFGEDTPENQIEKFHELGCQFVIMTLGKDGAIVSCEGEKVSHETKATDIVDTTGAGDAFWSGFYTGITQGETIEKAVEIGLLTSAYKLKFVGAVVDLPHYQDLYQI